MLLSLLSKRSLEIDSRDLHGFALRPQHVQRYNEYSFIYKEEEVERSTKWRIFLEKITSLSKSCQSDNEKQENLDSEKGENLTTGNENYNQPCHSGKEDKGSAEAGDKKCVPNETEQGNLETGVRSSQEKKKCKVEKWIDIQSPIGAIENLSSSSDRKRKHIENKNVNLSNGLLQSIDEGRDSGEEVCVKETSDDCDSPQRRQNSSVYDASQDSFSPQNELEFLVRGGVPKDLRGEVWQAFVGVRTHRVENYYDDLIAQSNDEDDNKEKDISSGVPCKCKKQIEKDIPRTFPGHPALNENGRNSLRRLLIAYARHNPAVGYCQAMNFFAGLLLLLMPEENAFWTFVCIMDDYFDGYYTEEMIESQVDQLVFEELMRERFPKLVNHLDCLGVQVAWIFGPWFLSIFVNILPWESVFRVWDVLLFEGNRVMLFRTALALMELYGSALLTAKDAGDAITLLQSLTGSTFDSSQLVLIACMGFLAVTEARLKELREKHRPSVLVVVEERTKKQRVWKDSKALASKLYSFKHERGTVRKEGKANDLEECNPSDLEDLLQGVGSEGDPLPDLQEQVVWLKVELCRALEEKRAAVLRAEELETTLTDRFKEDNQLELAVRIEKLEQEVAFLQQALSDKREQESAMLKVLMKVEKDRKIIEDACRNAEQEVASQKDAIHVLEEKYRKAMALIAEMEKRVEVSKCMSDATVRYESDQAKATPSPRSVQTSSPRTESSSRRTSLLTFGLGWRDRNKGKTEESGESKPSVSADDE